jgi:lysophospholipase L1-like esterase
MTIRWAHENLDAWLDKLNPEVAVIMFGTNDLTELELDEYAARSRDVVARCLARGTVVILTTIPPRHDLADRSAEFAEAARSIARDLKVPLIDYHAEILKRRPDDWDGALEKFRDVPGDEYNVPTLISRDGVHPSNPQDYRDFSEESLSRNGYALRSALTLQAYADVIRQVLKREPR